MSISKIPGAKEPTVAIADDGRVCLVYGAGDTLYGRLSRDGGKTFDSERTIGTAGKLALGMRRGPRVVWAGKTAVVTAIYGTQGGGRDGDLVAFRVGADGAPTRVTDVAGAAREGLHAMASSHDGRTLACAWLDLREPGTTVYASVSRDGGKRWSRNVRVYRSPERTVCECCHTSVAFARDGSLLVLFRNVLRGDRDMYLCRSVDGGATFSAAEKIGRGSWPLDACPMDGGMVGAREGGGVATVWRRKGTVYRCDAGGVEQPLEDGQQPWLAVASEGVWYAWLNGGRPGALHVQPPRGPIRSLASAANDPVLAASPDGRRVVVGWTGPGGVEAQALA